MILSGFGYRPGTPATILGASLLQWCRADRGIAQSGGVVSQWDDLGGAAKHYTATSTAQPTWLATAGPNNTPALIFNGTSNYMSSPLNLPNPNTTPSWFWIVFKMISWTSNRRIACSGASASTVALYMGTASPQLWLYNGGGLGGNSDLAVGAWGAVQSYFSNSTADLLQVNDNAPVTGSATGVNTTTGRNIGGHPTASLFSNIAVAEVVYANALPAASQLASLANYRMALYGF